MGRFDVVRVRSIAPLMAAAALMTAAFAVASDAGCADPGRLEPTVEGYELVGGCIAPGDLLVPEPAPAPPTAPAGEPARG